LKRAATLLWFTAIAVLVALYYRHLSADFPNYSPWQDWSKFTDEGWYGDAAIRHFVLGHWFVVGDFNPGVALPMLPLAESAVFHFSGVSLEAVRALAVSFFVLGLIAAYALVRRFQSRWTALVAVTLLAISGFNYAFLRMGILEPLLILLTLLLYIAACRARWRHWVWLVACGVLVPLIVLTKTTGVCSLPAAAYLCWRANHHNRGLFVRCCIVVAGIAALLGGGYYFGLAAPHYKADFWYLFSANARPILTLHSRWDAVWGTFADGKWADPWLYPAALFVVLLSLLTARKLWRNPLFGACVIWAASYVVFIAWHCNLQPRYYLPVLPAMVMLVAICLEYAVRTRQRILTSALLLVLVIASVKNARQVCFWMRHPEYTYIDAARSLAETVRRDSQPNRLLMSISGSDITLMTGLPSICDDFGTEDLDVRIHHYNPGWYASWDDVDDGTLESLNEFYTLRRVASWAAMDDPERRVLILWRLVPLEKIKWRPGMTEGDAEPDDSAAQ
jgi:4-amino-4-deoxy-L-arabinose transferase-like glycosyltransferase